MGIGVRSGGLALTTTVLGIKVGLGETVRKGLEFGDCASKAQPIEAVATNPINNNSNPVATGVLRALRPLHPNDEIPNFLLLQATQVHAGGCPSRYHSSRRLGIIHLKYSQYSCD